MVFSRDPEAESIEAEYAALDKKEVREYFKSTRLYLQQLRYDKMLVNVQHALDFVLYIWKTFNLNTALCIF